MILTVCPNTAVDKIYFIERWTPGIPMRTNKMTVCVGGKGLNSSVVLSQLGVDTIGMGFFAGKVGQELIEVLQDYGITPDPIWVDGTTRISHVIAEEDTNIHSHLIVGELLINAAQDEEFIKEFEAKVAEADWVILAGTMPPSLSNDFYYRLIRIAQKAKVPCLIDSQKDYMAKAVEARPDIVKMNKEEFEWTFSVKAEDFDSLVAVAKNFRKEKGIDNLIITMSKDGILALTTAGTFLVKAPEQKPVNAAGAGDSVSSTLAWRLSLGEDWPTALHWAGAVSAATVLTKRTGDVRMEDVERIKPDVTVKKLD
ncbi:MAG: 1-phosphofructokinase [Chloroflexota bacterium]|nr:1-phosphofructokinase [Chloroflexota bacterium]